MSQKSGTPEHVPGTQRALDKQPRVDRPTEKEPSHVITEEAKAEHTTHWDMDVLPRAELERMTRAGRRRHTARRALIGLAVVALIAVVVLGLAWLS